MLFLKKIDQYEKDFLFSYKRGKFKTSVGGIVSMISFAFSLIQIWYFGKDIYFREDPRVSQKEMINEVYPYHNLTNKDFFFGLRVENATSYLLTDSKYFEYYLIHRNYTTNKTDGTNKLDEVDRQKLEFCDTRHVNQKYLVKLNLRYFMCGTLNRKVGGDWTGSAYMALYSYFIKRCDNYTEKRNNITCATDEEMYSKFGKRLYIAFVNRKNLFNPKGVYKDSYVVDSYNHDFVPFSSRSTKNHQYRYSMAQVFTDVGKMFDDKYNETFLSFNKLSTSTGDLVQDGDHSYLFAADFLLSNVHMSYTRTYVKVQTIAARVWGLYKISGVVIRFFLSYYIDNAYELFLYEKLLDLEIEDPDDDFTVNALHNNPNYKKKFKRQFNGNLSISQNINEVVGATLELQEIDQSQIEFLIKSNNNYIEMLKKEKPPPHNKANLPNLSKDNLVIKFSDNQEDQPPTNKEQQPMYNNLFHHNNLNNNNLIVQINDDRTSKEVKTSGNSSDFRVDSICEKSRSGDFENQDYDKEIQQTPNIIDNIPKGKTVDKDNRSKIQNEEARVELENNNLENEDQMHNFERGRKFDLVLNKDIFNAINFKRKKREKVNITFSEQCVSNSSCLNFESCKSKAIGMKRLRKELHNYAKEEITKKTNYISLLQGQEQLNLLSKIILHEQQSFMLKNNGVKVLVNKIKRSEEVRNLADMKKQRKINELYEYLKDNIANSNLSSTDLMLYAYMSQSMKRKLNAKLK